MPTLVFVSPKGGAGKTTAALMLALQLCEHYDVTAIDADPNHPIRDWAFDAIDPKTNQVVKINDNKPQRLSVVYDADEDNIIDKIEEAASATPFVIVDLEGSAAKIVLLAVSQADLVIIPSQGSPLDADQAARAIRVVQQSAKVKRQAIPYGVLLTRTNPTIRTRNTTHVQKTLIEAGIPVLQSELNEREAYKSVFGFRQTLNGLNPKDVPNLENAKLNVLELTAELLEKLKPAEQSAAAEVA